MQTRSKVLSKSIDTLVEDIYGLFRGHTVDPERSRLFGEAIANTIANRLASYSTDREFTLRVSNLGKPDRQLWYEANDPAKEELAGHTLIKFLFGDILEHLLLFLAAEAGHENSQRAAPYSQTDRLVPRCRRGIS